MRKLPICLLLLSGLLLPRSSGAQDPQKPARASDDAVTGRWLVNADLYGTVAYFTVELKSEGNKLTGNLNGDKLEGTLSGNAIHFVAKDEQGGTEECQATIQDDTISGKLTFTDAGDEAHPETHQFTAKRVPLRRAGVPHATNSHPQFFIVNSQPRTSRY